MENKKAILAIDDNIMQLDIYQKMLEKNYDVRVVNSASNAMHFMNANNVDIILLDIEMPNISGFDFLYDIRKIPSYMRVPIIIISGNSGEEFFNQARNSSAFDVLTKPVRKDALLEIIEKALLAAG